jgi:phasin family protein
VQCTTKQWEVDMAKLSSTNNGRSFEASDIGFDTMMASQRKNIEALMEANKMAIDAFQAVVSRQFEIGRQAADEMSSMIRDFVQPNCSVEDQVAKQAEYSKHVIENSLSTACEIGDLVSKVGTDATSVISKRIAESINEVQGYYVRKQPIWR